MLEEMTPEVFRYWVAQYLLDAEEIEKATGEDEGPVIDASNFAETVARERKRKEEA